jgi:hypothetical protein
MTVGGAHEAVYVFWHSLVTIRDAIQQTNAIIMAACGSDERPCQVAAHRGQIELGEIMIRTRVSDGILVWVQSV